MKNKFSKRDIGFFLLGILTMIFIELFFGVVKDIKTGFNDGLKGKKSNTELIK